MTAPVIKRDRFGNLTKIGQNGQGVVAAMPALVEDWQSYEEAERLIALAAWPCALSKAVAPPVGS
jgi:eukaryotic-like serine/threonine-protein kinase